MILKKENFDSEKHDRGDIANRKSQSNSDVILKHLPCGGEGSSLRRRTRNKTAANGYQSDDGEVVEVLGGF